MSLLRYHRDRLATQHILEDLEAQSPRRTHSWDVNSLYSNQPFDDTVYANEDDEFEVGYDDGVMQVDNNHQGDGSFNEDYGEKSDNKKTAGGGHCQFWKRHHYFILFTLLALGAVIAATMIFGPIGSRNNNNQNNDRTTNAAEGEDEITDQPTYAPSVTPTAAPVTASPTGTPTYFPTSWWPTYYPSFVPTAAPVGANFTGNETLIVGGNGTSVVSEANTTTEEVVVIDGNVTSNNETELFGNETTLIGNNETTLIEEEVDETSLETNDNTTTLSTAGSTEDIVDVITTTEATTIATNATTEGDTTEAATTEEATVPPTTTSEATTTITIAAALETTTTTVAAIPAHLCTNIPTGKIFKIDITPKSSTTSLELYQLHNEEKGEYKLVTAYPTADDELQEFKVGTNYIKKLCVLPGSYKFVVKKSNGACYKGFFRGNRIFKNCGNGEHEFEY
jgi:hypothetical protein